MSNKDISNSVFGGKKSAFINSSNKQKYLVSQQRGAVIWAGTEIGAGVCKACGNETKKVEVELRIMS